MITNTVLALEQGENKFKLIHYPMPRYERIARSIALLQEISPSRPLTTPETDDEATARLARVEREVMPTLNGHMRALGLRPVDADKVHRGAARPSPGLHLVLLGMRIASRMESVETRYIQSRPDGLARIDAALGRIAAKRGTGESSDTMKTKAGASA